CACAATTALAITASNIRRVKKFRPIMLSFAQKASGYAGRCAEGLWPSGKRVLLIFGLRPICRGGAPNFIVTRNGSAKRFRTSGGRAAGVNRFRQTIVPGCLPTLNSFLGGVLIICPTTTIDRLASVARLDWVFERLCKVRRSGHLI